MVNVTQPPPPPRAASPCTKNVTTTTPDMNAPKQLPCLRSRNGYFVCLFKLRTAHCAAPPLNNHQHQAAVHISGTSEGTKSRVFLIGSTQFLMSYVWLLQEDEDEEEEAVRRGGVTAQGRENAPPRLTLVGVTRHASERLTAPLIHSSTPPPEGRRASQQ